MGFFIVASLKPSLFMPAEIISLLVIFELFRIIISGVRHQKSGFWILLIGLLIQQISFLVFVMDIFNLFPVITPTYTYLLMILPQMGLPLPYALHLAWEFGAANRSLRSQLVQVKNLSETNLKQEQEKQEILTQQKDKLENMVTDRTRELSLQKEALQNTLVNLESTQAQLIQSEKMASLGELTAGIAHEIQNPLNFMNNFSEVNKELIEEMKHELLTGNLSEVTLIANNIQQNEDKINHHGKRADAIVKGMLQHSQSSAGRKEPTDLNALTDEYLRLAYHGYRAKEKSFNAMLKTNYDESIGKINIIPQDMGRVLLNIYNNAFYAVMQRKKTISEGYEPAISVSTKLNNGMAEIRVVDNGNGIPKKLIDKIFQPFFTTKPTGEGTGLGLSLSYDIIKTQGGALKVESKEGEGTEFVVLIPRN
jgi:signal transduction histidine kinase